MFVYSAALGLGCGTQDLPPLLRHAEPQLRLRDVQLLCVRSSSLTEDRTMPPARGAGVTHWTAREIPNAEFFIIVVISLLPSSLRVGAIKTFFKMEVEHNLGVYLLHWPV